MVQSPRRHIESLEATAIELRYLSSMAELDSIEVAAVEMMIKNIKLHLMCAHTGNGFTNINKLKVMNFKQKMKSLDDEKWVKEVANEKARFDKYNVLTPVPCSKHMVGSNK